MYLVESLFVICFIFETGNLLRQRLESNSGPAGDGPSPQVGSDQAGHGLSFDLQRHDRRANTPKGPRKERGLSPNQIFFHYDITKASINHSD